MKNIQASLVLIAFSSLIACGGEVVKTVDVAPAPQSSTDDAPSATGSVTAKPSSVASATLKPVTKEQARALGGRACGFAVAGGDAGAPPPSPSTGTFTADPGSTTAGMQGATNLTASVYTAPDPSGAGGTSVVLGFDFDYPAVEWFDVVRGRAISSGIGGIGVRLPDNAVLDVGTYENVTVDMGADSMTCYADGSGEGVGGGDSISTGETLTITKKTDTLLEGSLSSDAGGTYFTFSVPLDSK